MTFDASITRGIHSSLSDGWTYLNAGQRTQVPERVQAMTVSAFRNAQKSLPGETGAGAHGQSRSPGVPVVAELAANTRRVFVDLTGGPVTGVVLESSREVLMKQFTSVISRRLTFGSNLVISHIGSRVMHVPLRRTTNLYRAQVRITEVDLSSGMLSSWQFDELVDERIRLTVVPTADPLVGTIAPVADISRRMHEHSNAWVLADAPNIVAYLDMSMSKLGADTMLVDTSVLDGPEVTTLVFRDPEMFERMASLSYVSNVRGVKQTEVFPVSPTLPGGTSEPVLHLASLDSTARGSRRYHIETTMSQVSRYLTALSERLIMALMILPRVHIIGIDTEDDSFVSVSQARRIPHVSFLVDGVSAKVVVDRLLDNSLMTSIVDTYESPLLEAMGIDEAGGAAGVGLQLFNTPHDIDQLVRAAALLDQLGNQLTRRSV